MTAHGFPALVRSAKRADGTAQPASLEQLLTAAEVAQVLGVRPKRVYELGIPAVKISNRALRWRPSQLATWIQEREGA